MQTVACKNKLTLALSKQSFYFMQNKGVIKKDNIIHAKIWIDNSEPLLFHTINK